MQINSIERKNGSRRITTTFTEEDRENSKVDAAQAELCDINFIYAKTQLHEMVPLGSRRSPEFGEFTNELPYDEALSVIMEAERVFKELPSAERKKYNNSPKEYYQATIKEAYERNEAELKAKADKEKATDDAKELEKARKLVKDNPEE